MAKSYFSSKFNPAAQSELRKQLEKDGFVLKDVDHAFWQARKERNFITFYRSGKVVIQGKNVQEYVDKYLTFLKSNQSIHGLESITDLQNWIGTDESGKGDVFGPLVVAALYIDKKSEHKLWLLEAKDSKKMSTQKIIETAKLVKKIFIHTVVSLPPKKYNKLYQQFGNLNKLLAFAHAQAIQNLIEKTSCSVVISDKFGDEAILQDALGNTKDFKLIQKVRAEDNLAVAGASILARAKFVESLDQLSQKYEMDFPPGASKKVGIALQRFLHKYGKDELKNVAKTHFKTIQNL